MSSAAGGAGAEIVDGRLWLAASGDVLVRDGRRCLAVAGFLSDPETKSLAQWLERWARVSPAEGRPCRGQYALVHADAAQGILTLDRDPSAAERLCYAVVDGVLLFSLRARTLLADERIGGGLDKEAGAEAVLGGDLSVLFGSRSLFSGVHELRPGETLIATSAGMRLIKRTSPLLTPSPRPRTPAGFRREIVDAAALALGGEKRAAVSLSGGIDSATVAVAAVELLGADAVEAFTYEFIDTTRHAETPFAAQVCRRLGIRHHVVPVDYRQYVESLPEVVWRLETPRLLSGAWLPIARAARERGFSRLLTGYGMEIALETPRAFTLIDEIARLLPSIPRPDWTLRYWKTRLFHGWPLRRAARLVHPGLEPPYASFYYPLLCLLRHNGLIEDAGPFYPRALRALARGAMESDRAREAAAELRYLPLGEQCRRLHFDTYFLNRLMAGKQAACRDVGALQVSPALSLAGAALDDGSGAPRGLALQRAAFQADLPEAVLGRPKAGSIISADWTRRITSALEPLAAATAERLAPSHEAREILRRLYGRELAALGFWGRIFDSGPVPALPPTLESLDMRRLFEF